MTAGRTRSSHVRAWRRQWGGREEAVVSPLADCFSLPLPGWLTWLNYGTHNLWTFVIPFKVLCRYYSLKQGIWVYQAFRRKSLPLPSLSVNCTFPANSTGHGWVAHKSFRILRIAFAGERNLVLLMFRVSPSSGADVCFSSERWTPPRPPMSYRRIATLSSKNHKLFAVLQGAVRCWRVDWKR